MFSPFSINKNIFKRFNAGIETVDRAEVTTGICEKSFADYPSHSMKI